MINQMAKPSGLGHRQTNDYSGAPSYPRYLDDSAMDVSTLVYDVLPISCP